METQIPQCTFKVYDHLKYINIYLPDFLADEFYSGQLNYTNYRSSLIQ